MKTLVIVQSKFEDTELITTLNILDRNNISYYLWSPEGKDTVKGNRVAIVETNATLPSLNEFNSLFIPGGPAVNELIKNNKVIEIVNEFYKSNKVVSAICAAPTILLESGIMNDHKYTCYPGMGETKNKLDKDVHVDKNIVTGKDYEATKDFAFSLVDKIKNS